MSTDFRHVKTQKLEVNTDTIGGTTPVWETVTHINANTPMSLGEKTTEEVELRLWEDDGVSTKLKGTTTYGNVTFEVSDATNASNSRLATYEGDNTVHEYKLTMPETESGASDGYTLTWEGSVFKFAMSEVQDGEYQMVQVEITNNKGFTKA